MLKYVVKRVLTAIVTAYLVATLTFFIMNMVPGGPFLSEKAVTPQAQAAMEAKYGLDKPLGKQYITYMTGLAKGDLGLSLKKRGRTVSEIISTKFPVSARLGGLAMVFAVFVGVPLGAVAAFKRGKAIDNALVVLSTAGIAIPSFLSSTLLMYVFSTKLKLLPSLGLNNPQSYIMPVVALALYPTFYIARLMRSSMLDVMGQDYMRTARAKGVSTFKSIFKHALRNAILPVVTYLGPLLASLMTGSFIIEKIFNIPGLGSEFVGAITSRDYPMIMGTTIFLAVFVIFMNVVVDVAYAVVDPRIKLK
ncbi:ABC transporter permease [Treponema saccharophilum]|jgi:oligopeptide transport system permease protein|uniref:Binding-protein-dependent transport systems inner membrane component n=1 Tax=Treponema saccharophilum DSM 2985 TaxID=907348 RepID=H7EIE4_9SPIR|nr:ABC transporter permease [Treponema saccharophilum]EIC02595.1 binding-protein-dependent transport systems inner membrane component [Treponema saccharophilum DSM 2985]BDC96160.1 peptide ABC transporter permease [Treponema saccharophilum]